MESTPDAILTRSRGAAVPGDVPFGVNEMRLNARQWVVALAIVLAVALVTPRAWRKVEIFQPGPDYRVPYALSKDYWLCQRRLDLISYPERIPILGDSVVWGEYVQPSGALSHFLNEQAGRPDRFVNCGISGLFPLAMEGFLGDYAGALRGRKVIVHCNMLWMTSPERDLSTDKEMSFNHSGLVPQFFPRIPCYRAGANERIGAVLDRHVQFFSWVDHLHSAYYGEQNIPRWTLADDGSDPPSYPNAWKNPFSPLMAGIPAEPAYDPERGPASPRHKPWNAAGADPSYFDWVDPATSLQWQALERVVIRLRDRGCDVAVIIGPFNEHMVAAAQRPACGALRDTIAAWMSRNRFAVVVPRTLPSEMYADASHPLTKGYALLAERTWEDPAFRKWLGVP